MKDEGGISEEIAIKTGCHSADALIIIRFLSELEGLRMFIHTQNGETQTDLGVEALFSAWLRLTKYVIDMPAEGDMKKRQGFLVYVLKLLGLDEQFQIIQNASGGPGSHDVPTDGEARTSD